jgi:SAM-dependent methyltransferase
MISTQSASTPQAPHTERAAGGVYVQFGCGLCAPDGWLNFDASYTLAFERLPVIGKLYTRNNHRFPPQVRYGDVVKGLPLPEGCADGVYASHILEHLAYDDCVQALRNTYRLLKPGGIFRLLVPDLAVCARKYLAALQASSPDANGSFMESTSLGRRQRPRGLRGLVYLWLNGSTHLWMWDEPAMMRALEAQGFRDIRRCSFHDCEDKMFQTVEDPRRFEEAVAIEARR